MKPDRGIMGEESVLSRFKIADTGFLFVCLFEGTKQLYQGESTGVEFQNLIFEAKYYKIDQDGATVWIPCVS